jgi:hypothetical protein
VSRVKLPETATTELARRYLARAQTEAALVSYLRGLCDALGVDPARYDSFDDEKGELVLKPRSPGRGR